MARRGAVRALAVVLGVTLVYRLGVTVVPLADFGGLAWEFFLARWFEWVLGAVIAEWAVGRLALPRVVFRPETAALALGLGVLFEWQTWRYGLYTFKDLLYGIAFALLLCVALHRERAGRPSAVGRSLAAFGLFSYSLYLLHRPIQLAVEPLARDVATWPLVLAYGIPSSLLIMSATMPIVLGASWLFYRYCEAPCVVRAQRAGRGEGYSLWPRSSTGTVRT
jgi:peptidoglycan/LPS O-acetylase OafA/YrhL